MRTNVLQVLKNEKSWINKRTQLSRCRPVTMISKSTNDSLITTTTTTSTIQLWEFSILLNEFDNLFIAIAHGERCTWWRGEHIQMWTNYRLSSKHRNFGWNRRRCPTSCRSQRRMSLIIIFWMAIEMCEHWIDEYTRVHTCCRLSGVECLSKDDIFVFQFQYQYVHLGRSDWSSGESGKRWIIFNLCLLNAFTISHECSTFSKQTHTQYAPEQSVGYLYLYKTH